MPKHLKDLTDAEKIEVDITIDMIIRHVERLAEIQEIPWEGVIEAIAHIIDRKQLFIIKN